MVLILGLLIQIISLILVLRQTRSRWIAHTGVLFVIFCILYHGLTEIGNLVVSREGPFRWMVSDDDLEEWVLLVSFAIFLFSFIYSWKLKQLSSQNVAKMLPSYVPGIISWKLLMALTIPAYLVKTSGVQLGYWAAGLSNQFVIVSIILTSFTFLAEVGSAYVVPVIIVQALVVSLIGNRLTVGLTCIAVLSLLKRHQISITLRQIIFAVILVGLLSVVISTARVTVGREPFLCGDLRRRGTAMESGLMGVIEAAPLDESPLETFAFRLDGNCFGAFVHQRLAHTPCAGLRSFWNNVSMTVPRFLNPLKLERSAADINEETYMVIHYNLPPGLDYIHTTLGILYSYYGTTGLLITVIFMGWLFAIIDNWLLTNRSIFALLVGSGLTICVISIEAGVAIYPNTFRGILTLWLLLVVISNVRQSISKRPKELFPNKQRRLSLRGFR